MGNTYGESVGFCGTGCTKKTEEDTGGTDMALVRWNPWGELVSMQEQLGQAFFERPRDYVAHLPLDIRQTDEAFIIEGSVPGFKPEQVEVTFDNGILTVSANWQDEHEEKRGEFVRRERQMSSFYRQITLPAEVRSDEIDASFTNGVLTITVPRTQKPQPKKIPVKTTIGSESHTTKVKATAGSAS